MSDDNLQQLANLFPNVGAGAIQDALEQSASVEEAVEKLLVVSDKLSQDAERREQIARDEQIANEIAKLELKQPTPGEPGSSYVLIDGSESKAIPDERDEDSAEELEAELEGKTDEAARLQQELENRVMENPGKVERALREFQQVFADLKAKGNVNADKLMSHLKEALAMIDTTLRSVRARLAVAGGKAKDASMQILEKLKNFAATLRAEVRSALAKVSHKDAVPSEEEERAQLEEYLNNLDERETELKEMAA